MININKFYLFVLSVTLINSQASFSQDLLIPQVSSFKSLIFPISSTNSSNKVDSPLTSNTSVSQTLKTNSTNNKKGYFLSDSETDMPNQGMNLLTASQTLKTNTTNNKKGYFLSDSETDMPNQGMNLLTASQTLKTNCTNNKKGYFFSDSETDMPNQGMNFLTASQTLKTNSTNNKKGYFLSDSETDMPNQGMNLLTASQTLKTNSTNNKKGYFLSDSGSTLSNVNTPSDDTDQASINNDLESLENASIGNRMLMNINSCSTFSYLPHLIFKTHSTTDANHSNFQINPNLHNFTSWEKAGPQLQIHLLSENNSISNNPKESLSLPNPQINLSSNKYINILKKVGLFALITNTEFSIASASWNTLKGNHVLYHIIFLTSDFIYCTLPFLNGNSQTLRTLKTMTSPLVCQLISSLFISAGLLYFFIKYKDISPDICLGINIFSNTLTGFTFTIWATCLSLMNN